MSFLNRSININNLKLNNRLVMPPLETGKASEINEVTDELIKHYDEKTKGSYIGLIISEHSYISEEGKASKRQLSSSKDSDIKGLSKLAKTIHQNNTKVFLQLNHAGIAAKKEVTSHIALGPSSINLPNAPIDKELPKEMNQEDINKVINDFKDAAIRAKKAGFDGVEIHSAHGYLLNQFYSPITNKRNDEYNGNTIEGRTKIHIQIIKAIKEAVGNDYLVALRLGACDYMNNGSTIEDSIEACKLFEKAGVDLLDISGGLCKYKNPYNDDRQGYFKELAKAIKDNVNIPVILTGGISNPNIAEELLKDDYADLIGVGKAILKDSNWAKEAIESLK